MNEKFNAFAKNMFKVGTPECAIFFGVAAMVLALMFLVAGFWETLLIIALVLVGAFIGGVKDKKEWLRKAANSLFPAKQQVPYRARNEEIKKAVQETLKEQAEEKAEEQAEEKED